MEIINYIFLCLFLTPFIIIVGLYFLVIIYLPIYMLCEYRSLKKDKKWKDLRKLWGKQTGDIEEVINDSCNELQYIYDNYDKIFNDDTETF